MKSKVNIHYDLLGSVPAVECFRDSLDELILRYETTGPVRRPEFGLMSETDIKLYVNEAFRDPCSMQHMADGIAIELCAQHFFGLRGTDFNTIAELISAMNDLEIQPRVA